MSTQDFKAGDTQLINLEDVDVSAIESSRKLPPPLPADASSPSMTPSMAPSMPPPAPKPRTGFYVGLLVAFIVVGVGIGIVAAITMSGGSRGSRGRGTPQAATPGSGVITIPTVEMDDSPDAGP